MRGKGLHHPFFVFLKNPGFQKDRPFSKNPGFQKTVLFIKNPGFQGLRSTHWSAQKPGFCTLLFEMTSFVFLTISKFLKNQTHLHQFLKIIYFLFTTFYSLDSIASSHHLCQ